MAARIPPRYDLVGGRLCLDYCNTTNDRRGYPEERLEGYADVVGWAWHAGGLNAEQAHGLAEGRRMRPGALDTLNGELSGAMARSQVVPTDAGFTWLWAEGGKALDCVLWPIARSAADLLTEGPLSAIRVCEGRACGWLFLDTSRNRTRRWCDMRICGHRAKDRRHHERVKTGAA